MNCCGDHKEKKQVLENDIQPQKPQTNSLVMGIAGVFFALLMIYLFMRVSS